MPRSRARRHPLVSSVRRRNTSSSVGRARATETTPIPAAATAGRISRAALAGSATATVSRPCSTPAPVHPLARCAGGAASGLERVVLARLGLDAVHGQRVPIEEVRERPLDDEPAAGEDPDAVADPLDVGQDVRGEQDGDLAAQRGDEVEDVAPALRVERADRLVEDRDGWAMDEGTGDPEPLAHAPGVGAASAIRSRCHVDAGEGVVDRRLERRPARGRATDRAGAAGRARSSIRTPVGPARGSRAAGGPRARRPRRGCRRPSRRPVVARVSPASSRRVVVLPAPLGPRRPKTDPVGTYHRQAVEGEDAAWVALGQPVDLDRRRCVLGGSGVRVGGGGTLRDAGVEEPCRRRGASVHGRRGGRGDRRIVRAAPAGHRPRPRRRRLDRSLPRARRGGRRSGPAG